MNRLALPGEINGGPFDRFTLVHFASGVALRAAGVPFWATIVVAIGWELVENSLKDDLPDFFPNATHDVASNAVVDVAAMLAGWASLEAIK